MRPTSSIISLTTALLLASAMGVGCGGFFEKDGKGDAPGGRSRHGDKSDDCNGSGGSGADEGPIGPVADAGVTPSSPDATTSTTSGMPVDAGTGALDAALEPDASTTVVDAGTTPLDAGSVTCAPGECACTRDTDCPLELVCDHAARVCVTPPVRCVDLTTEAACVAASATCTPVYAGQNCRDATGGECTAGDVNCTCATFSFAACVDR